MPCKVFSDKWIQVVKIEQKIKFNLWCFVAALLLLGSFCLGGAVFSADIFQTLEMPSAEAVDLVLDEDAGSSSDREQRAAWNYDCEPVWRCAVRSSRGDNLRLNAVAADHEKVVAVHIDYTATHQLRTLELQFCETEYINICKLRRRVLPLRAGPVSV